MKTIEELKATYYYETLYDEIEARIEEIRKAKGWRTVNEKRYNEAMNEIAKEWDTDADALKEYYEE